MYVSICENAPGKPVAIILLPVENFLLIFLIQSLAFKLKSFIFGSLILNPRSLTYIENLADSNAKLRLNMEKVARKRVKPFLNMEKGFYSPGNPFLVNEKVF